MKTIKLLRLSIGFSIAVGAIESSNSTDQTASDLRFQGRCVITEPGHDAIRFDVTLGEQVEPLKIIEIDSFGNEIITHVKLFFRFDDVLAARFQTDLPAPLTGHASVSNVTAGTRLSALFPTKLGKQLDCSASVVSTAR